MLRRVLVAIDESDLSERVIQALNQLQLPDEAELLLAHVIVPLNDAPDVVSDRPVVEVEDRSEASLEKLQAYQTQFPYPSTLEVVMGDPAEELIRLAHIHQADLIVMGCRGLKGLNRVLKGSVSSQVVEGAPCSVLVIK